MNRPWIIKHALHGLPALLLIGSFAAAAPVNFSRDVLPILSDTCFQCHGPDAKEGRKGKLRLDQEADVKRARDGYHIVKPGDAAASALYQRITETDPDEIMPPPKLDRALSAQQKATLKQWINEGATWGKHWAFERIERPERADAQLHPIDGFVARRLVEENMKPNARASRRSLIRRLKLDLTGLPPTPEQIATFLADEKPGAWERLVDRTLSSPAYGERMAWDWLDAARYADTNGYQGDNERTMWPWRDWVVDAFNTNLPYDDFTVWQLAGDLLPEATPDQVLATGFNRNHMINGEGGSIPEENRVNYVFDMTETMGTIWLGLTLNCCRCHDHKFDPLLQKEYYQFNAFFNQTPVNGGGGNAQTPPVLQAGSRSQNEKIAADGAALDKVKTTIAQRLMDTVPEQKAWEAKLLENPPDHAWKILTPLKASAKGQRLEILDGGLLLADGENPEKDEYEIQYALAPGKVTGFKLEAVRHPKMTKGGLARSDSGNFVLTDIGFQVRHADGKAVDLKIDSAVASFEQGVLKITSAFDQDATSGWAVWNGKSLDRDHAGAFRFKTPVDIPKGARLQVTMKFNSPHKHHNLGHFRFSSSEALTPELGDNDGLYAALQLPADKRSKDQEKEIKDAFEASDPELAKLRKQQSGIEKKIQSLKKGIPKVMVMADMDKPRKTFMLERGLYNQPGDEVSAAVPAFLPELPDPKAANRLDLARWLVDRENPLTSRVTVNRIWQMIFGIGLVKTSEDFGVQSEYPIQRELLDWLAVEFMESGWDLKHLVKTIVTSDAYQRNSQIASPEIFEQDPQNRTLARGPRFRMPSWMIRDQALAASGLLSSESGGPSVNSYQPVGIWSEATFGEKKYTPAKGEALYRRSLYTFWRRIIGPTMFFDTARRQVCEVKPLRTNTPMHALSTLNDVTYVEAARALAENVLRDALDEAHRMQLAGQRLLGRTPTKAEQAIWQRSLQRAAAIYEAHPEEAKRFIAIGASSPDEKLSAKELASWTALCLNLLNLDETLTKE